MTFLYKIFVLSQNMLNARGRVWLLVRSQRAAGPHLAAFCAVRKCSKSLCNKRTLSIATLQILLDEHVC